MSKAFLLGLITALTVITYAASDAQEGLLITDFEKHPNYLNGEVGVFGAGETDWDNKVKPYSWYYTPEVKGYDKENVVSGQQSFRLVNGIGPRRDVGWASFGLDLGPVIDPDTTPVKIKPLDVSGYKYLSFWAKGEKGGERFAVNFRDAHAADYMPQCQYLIEEPLTARWRRIAVPLDEVSGVDLKELVHVGLEFGEDVDNSLDSVIYVDDFAFTDYASLQ